MLLRRQLQIILALVQIKKNLLFCFCSFSMLRKKKNVYSSRLKHLKLNTSINIVAKIDIDALLLLPEVESSRTSLASRTSSRTDFEVLGLGLGLEGQVLGLGLEASSPRKLACPRLEDSTIFWKVKILWSG